MTKDVHEVCTSQRLSNKVCPDGPTNLYIARFDKSSIVFVSGKCV